MNGWNDVDSVPDNVVLVIVEDTETKKVWQPKVARYDPYYKYWMDEKGWILNFDRFNVIAWKSI